jgi:hypothetical protein
MSEVLNIYDFLKFKSSIVFSSEGCLNYVNRQNSREVFLTYSIPIEILIKWRQIKVQHKFPIPYVDLLHLSQARPGCFLKEEAKVRIEKRLAELCYNAYKSCIGIIGNKRIERLRQVKKLAIHFHEIEDVKHLLSEINTLQEEKIQLEEQVENLETRCDSLLKDVAELKQNADRDAGLEQAFTEAEDKNKELQEYIEKLIERDSCKHCDSYSNKGNTYDKVSYTQQRRKLKELKSNAEKALWFLKTFGFEIDKISLIDTSGAKVNLDYSGIKKSGYQFLAEDEKDKVRSVVYLMDLFCVSDAAYHELSMIDQENLPRSYLIKQCRQDLNKVYCISRTPGEWPGAQLSFKDELHHQLAKQVKMY